MNYATNCHILESLLTIFDQIPLFLTFIFRLDYFIEGSHLINGILLLFNPNILRNHSLLNITQLIKVK